MADISAGTLYEINQSIMRQQSPLNNKKLEEAKKIVKAYFMERFEKTYFMLLCKEMSDFTVFKISAKLNCGIATNELIETLKNRGKILSIGKNSSDDSSLEIWVKCSEDDEPHAYYLFVYDWGIIEC